MGLSLEERKRKLIEDVCASCSGGGGMQVGDGGFEGSADPAGPVAGYDPLMKGLKMLRKRKKKKQDGT